MGKWMKKCVVVCPKNCKIKNVLFFKNITKNRILEKINNVNMQFLVLSVCKVQNRLLLKTREHKDFIANYR